LLHKYQTIIIIQLTISIHFQIGRPYLED